MESLLKQLYLIHKEYKMLAEREEKFNIFSALHKEHDERRLHSRFLSVLLQPKGSHGFNSEFLRLFIQNVNSTGAIMETDSNSDNETEDCESDFERTQFVNFNITQDTLVYPTENDKKENNNIDILIIDRKNKQAIILENKIYAGDSDGGGGKQIFRYIEHVVSKEHIPIENTHVIYLTLDGHDPSKESVHTYYGKKDIILCSYQHLITSWLEECLTLTARAPFLRESILQYIKLIKKMTVDDTSVEERKAYRKLIGYSKENMQAAYKLHQNFKHVKWHAVYDFWNALQSLIVENGYALTNRVVDPNGKSQIVTDLTHYEDYRKGQKNKQHCKINFEIPEGLGITIRFSPDEGFYFGVSNKIQITEEIKSKFEKLINEDSLYKRESWMHICRHFNKQVVFNDFNKQLTFSLIDENKNTELVECTWNEVEEFIEALKNEK